MRVELKIAEGHDAGKLVVLGGGERLTLGRSTIAGFQVVDQAVSRRHCIVEVTDCGCQITDLASANGTYLNGRRITQTDLSSGDEIRLGSTILSVVADPEPGAAVPCLPCERCGLAADSLEARDPKGAVLCAACLPPPREAPVIGGYRVLKIIGRGAMGTVYRAESLAGGVAVAIKALALDRAQNETCVRRFIREASLSASLHHPNIAQVYDMIEVQGTYCLVMELVDGTSAIDLIKRAGRLEVPMAARIAREIAGALAYALERKVIHRDVKPHNILVARDGTSKLVDFGIAKSMEHAGMSRITAPGQQLGTLGYMPPEQLRNALTADQRSDVYSLGASLYHMLAGAPPVAGPDMEAIVIAILDGKPQPVRQINPAVPPELALVIDRSLEKEPRDRYQAPGELERDLRALGY